MILDFIQKYPFILAFILGLIPALIWLWFWLKEDTHPEPAKMVTLSFLGGMAAVLFVLPLQKIIYTSIQNNEALSFTLYAAIEEILKFAFVYFIAIRNKKVTDEPVDDIIYLIISALGFVTLENTLFLIPGITNGDFLNTIVYGNSRFLGASLLHIMTSGIVGITIALAFFKTKKQKIYYTISGLVIAIILHTAFNLSIMNMPGGYLITFFFVWIGIVGLLLMFEKVKHIKVPVLDQPL